jgi:hypothetical protein
MMTKKYLAIFSIYSILSAGCSGAVTQTSGASETIPESSSVSTSPPLNNTEETATAGGEEERNPEDVVPVIMSPPSGDERIVGISTGSPAPFTGVLLNESAAAWLEAEPDAARERCQLFLDRRVGELEARLLAETDRLTLRINTMIEVHAIELRARDERVASLTEMNENLRNNSGEWWEQALFVGGALVVGAAIGIIIGFVGAN